MVIKKLLPLNNGVSSLPIQSGRVAYGFGLCVGLSLLIFYVLVPTCSHTAPPVSSIASPPFFTWFSTAPPTHQHGGSARNRTAVNPPEPGGSLDKAGSFGVGIGNSTAADVLVSEHRNATEETKGVILGGAHVETGKGEASGNGTEAVGIDSDERRRGKIGSLGGGSSSACDIFDGRWVRDNRKPFYPPGSCPYVDMSFNCHKNGRPDRDFLKWRWQPNACNIPRMNATDFLERLRGQRLVFVGDSLNRNMWESLVCTLRQSLANKRRASEISGRTQFKAQGYYSFTFKDYSCSVEFVRAPFLVKEARKLRLDLLEESASVYRKADIIVFNTGHWWTHEKTAKGIDYYQVGNYVYPVLPLMDAYEQGLRTWARWVDKNINRQKTLVFFRGFSPTHFRGGRWNSGGKCHNETEPIFNEKFLGEYPSLMFALEKTLKKMKTPVTYLNISRLTDYRKDGHPSIYRMRYKNIEEQIASLRSQDCSHWCLPGIPDTWNELLYASLLRIGRGKWRN